MAHRLLAAAVVLVAATAVADTSSALRDGNSAATAGDWALVRAVVEPLLANQLAPADLAEAHRLAGLAAFFQGRSAEAEAHFIAYLRIDLDGNLDPALYPPEVLTFFNDIKSKHGSELRAARPKPRRYFLLNFVPPVGQLQNGERVKGYVLGGLLGAFAVTNVTTYFVLRSWCTPTTGSGSQTVVCDNNKDHTRAAGELRTLNIATGVALIGTYVYGVYDGVETYRRRERESIQPFVAPVSNGAVLGLNGSF
jgi:hypothetical protein